MTRILVVEDEGIVAFDICEELSAFGYDVVGHTPSGEEAVSRAEKLKPDLIFMDINLSGEMDGIQAASIIQTKFNIPVVFLTAHAEEQTLQRAKLIRPYGYIIKPFEKDDLRVAVEMAISRFELDQSSHAVDEDEQTTHWATSGEPQSLEGREEMLATHPIFKTLTPENRRTLAHTSTIRELNAGECIILEGDHIDGGFIVLSGRLAVVKSTESGKELTVELLSHGDVTGMLMALENQPPRYSVRAQVDSKLLWVSIPTLKLVLRAQPEFYETFFLAFADRVHRFGELALSLAHAKVEQRIVATFLALAPRLGKAGQTQDQIRLFLTRKELADLTGTTPETAIRVTKALERQGYLDLTRPGIIKILSLDALRGAPI
jgi:two-component system, response regulator PdtaR